MQKIAHIYTPRHCLLSLQFREKKGGDMNLKHVGWVGGREAEESDVIIF